MDEEEGKPTVEVALTVGPIVILVPPRHAGLLEALAKHATFMADCESGWRWLDGDRRIGIALGVRTPNETTKEAQKHDSNPSDVPTRH